jgi:GNAT superfamily N-acetyltransferase
VPTPESAVKRSFENFEKAYFSSPGFMADSFFVALDNGEFVGMTALRKSLADERKLLTGLTGVVRSHRRRGIATALKVRAIEFATQYGAEIIETGNEENNPMFDINLMLGFKPRPAWYSSTAAGMLKTRMRPRCDYFLPFTGCLSSWPERR